MASTSNRDVQRSTAQVQLATRLREAREYLGLSQEAVAAKAGISRGALSAIENGKRKIEALELQVLASLYRHPVDFFLTQPSDVPEGVRAIAREAVELTEKDREEVLRFAQFLKGYTRQGPAAASPPETIES